MKKIIDIVIVLLTIIMFIINLLVGDCGMRIILLGLIIIIFLLGIGGKQSK